MATIRIHKNTYNQFVVIEGVAELPISHCSFTVTVNKVTVYNRYTLKNYIDTQFTNILLSQIGGETSPIYETYTDITIFTQDLLSLLDRTKMLTSEDTADQGSDFTAYYILSKNT